MFIVLLAEPGLFVFESAADAVREIEPPDAEKDLRAAFDDAAIPYRVEWIRPNEHSTVTTLFGQVPAVDLGEYRFVPAGQADRGALIALLEEHPLTDPPEAKGDVDALLQRMRANRDESGVEDDVD